MNKGGPLGLPYYFPFFCFAFSAFSDNGYLTTPSSGELAVAYSLRAILPAM
jgi:hypothetical protein